MKKYLFTITAILILAASCSKTPKAVDLGLSVNWASFNVGAKSESGVGEFYAWGETEPKEEYTWKTYKWNDGSNSSTGLFKYKGEFLSEEKIELEPEDDAAAVKLGKGWRIPTEQEWDELINECTWTWTEKKGVAGYEVESNKNGKSIFFPVTGYVEGKDQYMDEPEGLYWASTLSWVSNSRASYLRFSEERHNRLYEMRYIGLPVRAVKEKKK